MPHTHTAELSSPFSSLSLPTYTHSILCLGCLQNAETGVEGSWDGAALGQRHDMHAQAAPAPNSSYSRHFPARFLCFGTCTCSRT